MAQLQDAFSISPEMQLLQLPTVALLLVPSKYIGFPIRFLVLGLSLTESCFVPYRQPITTGTSILGVAFEGGVMLAGDMLGSYGSLAKFRSIERIIKVNDTTILGASGDIADFQYLKSLIEQRV